MTTDTAARRYRRTKACILIIAAIVAFPLTVMILLAACNEGRR